jgi:predicted DsbA family dithiol-disulfide isomerase
VVVTAPAPVGTDAGTASNVGRDTPVAATVGVLIDYWTDPLCCWSWAFEPQWRRLRYEFDGRVTWSYRMGGMIPDWSSYSDPLNSVSRPMQMGPLWFQARHVSGMPIDDKVWVEDPPGSSYLPCVAVKAAGQQSARAAELYLRRLREAVMLHRRNVARREVLLAVAAELAADRPGELDAERFARDLDSPAALDAFRQDVQQAGYRQLGRFPTLTLRRPGAADGLMLVGYRPYAALLAAVKRVAPELEPTHPAPCPEAYAAYWGDLLPRELEEIRAGVTLEPKTPFA